MLRILIRTKVSFASGACADTVCAEAVPDPPPPARLPKHGSRLADAEIGTAASPWTSVPRAAGLARRPKERFSREGRRRLSTRALFGSPRLGCPVSRRLGTSPCAASPQRNRGAGLGGASARVRDELVGDRVVELLDGGPVLRDGAQQLVTLVPLPSESLSESLSESYSVPDPPPTHPPHQPPPAASIRAAPRGVPARRRRPCRRRRPGPAAGTPRALRHTHIHTHTRDPTHPPTPIPHPPTHPPTRRTLPSDAQQRKRLAPGPGGGGRRRHGRAEAAVSRHPPAGLYLRPFQSIRVTPAGRWGRTGGRAGG